MLFGPSRKGLKRQRKGGKGRKMPVSRKGSQTPLKPPFVTPPFAASRPKTEMLKFKKLPVNFQRRSWELRGSLMTSFCWSMKGRATTRKDPSRVDSGTFLDSRSPLLSRVWGLPDVQVTRVFCPEGMCRVFPELLQTQIVQRLRTTTKYSKWHFPVENQWILHPGGC